ncbi:MAG: MarR family winged helix-turn-helix transcriptional regulator [Pseudonocardia sp.]
MERDPRDGEIERLVRQLTLLVRRSRKVARTLAAQVHPEVDAGAYAVLLLVADTGGPRLVDVAEQLGLDKSTMSRQIGQLIRLGLLTRRPDPQDRRAFRLELTDSGAQRLAAVTRERRAVWRERLAAWPEGDIAALADGLARLARDLPG